MAALVWFVDRSPRSRKPVQYKLLEDFIASESKPSGLLPVLLPCALCAAQQQITAVTAANDLYEKRKKYQELPKDEDSKIDQTDNVKKASSLPPDDLNNYNEFVKLCQHVELLLEKTRIKLIATEEKSNTKEVQADDNDDFWQRSLKDANRNPSNPFDTNGFLATFSTTENHYVWRTPRDKYKSQFFPMRQHDLVRDDLAFRKLNNNNKATGVAERPARPHSLEDPIFRKPPPHPNPPRKRPHSLPPNRRVAGRHQLRQSH